MTPVIRTLPDLRMLTAEWRDEGQTIAVVPTMGALHAGHASLIRAAVREADRVIVTLFVNPKQFNNPDDLAHYPGTEEDDREKAEASGAHVLYAPDASQVYPDGFATTVSVSGVSDGLCGAFRPGHFDGVATVVAKLLIQTSADIAFFGEKDFQQLHVVRRMALDLDIPVRIVACPTVREEDGLALSSRNVHLTPEERAIAPRLAKVLRATAKRIVAGADIQEVLDGARKAIIDAGFADVEYIELRSEDDLTPLFQLDRPGRILVAAWLGKTRLVDNVTVG